MESIFSRILVGVDASEVSRESVSLAARLAREHDGQLVLCYSANWLPLIAQSESTGALIDPNPIIDGMKEQGDALLAEAAEAAKALGVDPVRRSVDGDPAQSLLKTADETQSSLIVMGTHGRSGVRRFFIGSTTEGVLRTSTIPVLTVRPGERMAPLTCRAFERVVVGIDDSEPSDAAVTTILDFPAEDRRGVLFFSVADIDSVIGGRGYFYEDVRSSLKDQAQRTVDRALAAARARKVPADGGIAEGSTSAELIGAVNKNQADLIVLGSHGRRGLRRFFFGSVAESIVRTAPVPVLVVRIAAARERSTMPTRGVTPEIAVVG